MADIETDLQKLLAGEIVTVESEDFQCSFKDLTSSKELLTDDYVPLVKRTVCYIAMALVFNDEGQVVLIQEAKENCRGKWYIPAGRVEPGENFIDGVKREVLEETGLECEPLTLFCLESSDLNWYRVGYIGRAVGGKLKTLDEQDSESLQAQWFNVDDILNDRVKPLRHKDFFKSLKIGHQYIFKSESERHPAYHIGIQPHKHLLCRPVVIKSTTEGDIEILCCQKNGRMRLPCCRLNPKEYSLSSVFSYLMKEVCQTHSAYEILSCTTKGLLTVEHCGKPEREHDGICLTPVFVLPSNLHEKLEKLANAHYCWYKVTDSALLEELKRRTLKDDMLVHIFG